MWVEYLEDHEIQDIAENYLIVNGLDSSLPIDIERHLENDLDFEIVPIPNLQNEFDIEGFSSGTWNQIWIDEDIYFNNSEVSRQSVKSCEDWMRFYLGMNESSRSIFEYQGYAFAGMFLVPHKFLASEFNQQLLQQRNNIVEAQNKGISRTKYLEYIVDGIANSIAPKFFVSRNVLQRRILNSGLIDMIP